VAVAAAAGKLRCARAAPRGVSIRSSLIAAA
jgi:hypothetical protein